MAACAMPAVLVPIRTSASGYSLFTVSAIEFSISVSDLRCCKGQSVVAVDRAFYSARPCERLVRSKEHRLYRKKCVCNFYFSYVLCLSLSCFRVAVYPKNSATARAVLCNGIVRARYRASDHDVVRADLPRSRGSSHPHLIEGLHRPQSELPASR